MDEKFYKEIGKATEYARKHGGSLTEQNLLYVVKIANNMSVKTGVDFDMLLGEGVIAMMKAEEKYDSTKNDSFAKSAGSAIRGYMLNAINRQSNLVHIPVNHLKGFKKGQEKLESANVKYSEIDSTNYDTLGTVENGAFDNDMEQILNEGLEMLDINGRIAIQMKLRLGKYGEMIPSRKNPEIMEYRYKNTMTAIAEELEVPVPLANRIYKEAFEKISEYCQENY